MSSDEIRTLTDIPRVHGRKQSGAVAVLFEGRSLTYGTLDRRSDAVAGFLQELGVKPGNRVAWLGRPSEAWYEIFFGVAKLRACFAPINSRLAEPEIAFILNDSEAEILFTTPEYFETVQNVLASIDRTIKVISVGGANTAFEDYETLRASAPAPILSVAQDQDDVLQLYTSGTTGLPKGVRLTNANYSAFIKLRLSVEGFNYNSDETVLILMPMFHAAGTNISISGLSAGARLVLQADFAPRDVLQTFEKEKVNHVFLAPVMINTLLQTEGIDEIDFSQLKTVSYGASPISEAVLDKATKTFGCGFIQFYGMTETTAAGTTLAPADHHGGLMRSCGKAWKDLEVRIADENGSALGPHEIGEIEIRGPIIMAGYWKRPEATLETIRADGWLRTGDAGYIDEHGYVFIHDRVKDMIVSGGENVYPAEVENAILGCPGVADAAVIGVPDERWGEAVKAIIVLKPGEGLTPDAVIAWTRQKIAGFKVPKSVEFADALPRNSSGKVLRRELRKPFWEGRDRQVS